MILTRPILYSFRRCPYAMRARLAIAAAGVECELREILLRDKAPEFTTASPKATVPVVVTSEGSVIEESFEVMQWALGQSDPEGWLELGDDEADARKQIDRADSEFKDALDHYKYASRYPEIDAANEREIASRFLMELNDQLDGKAWLYGDKPKLADFAILPFVRQFANVDRAWFDAQAWPNILGWLERFLQSDRFLAIMQKYPQWHNGDAPTIFPPKPV